MEMRLSTNCVFSTTFWHSLSEARKTDNDELLDVLLNHFKLEEGNVSDASHSEMYFLKIKIKTLERMSKVSR